MRSSVFAAVLLTMLQPARSERSFTSIENPPPILPTVVCFGDSLTHAGYPAELEQILPVRTVNAGVRGNTSRQGLKRLEGDVLSHKPDAVVVLFGTNDTRVDAPGVYVPLPEYEKNLTEIIDRCHDIGARVLLGTMPPIDKETYFTRHRKATFDAAGGLETLIEDYRSVVLRVAKNTGIPVIDFNRDLAADTSWRSPDGVHPTPDGNRAIARLVAESLKPALVE